MSVDRILYMLEFLNVEMVEEHREVQDRNEAQATPGLVDTQKMSTQ